MREEEADDEHRERAQFRGQERPALLYQESNIVRAGQAVRPHSDETSGQPCLYTTPKKDRTESPYPATKKMMDSSERVLRSRLLAGEPVAFTEVVDTHYRSIYRQQYLLCGNRELAEDLTQETFVQAWQSIARFRGDSSLRTWLYTIAVRVWRKHLRTRPEDWVSLEPSTWESLTDPTTRTEAQWEQRCQQSRVQEALQRLPLLYREVVVLLYIHEMSQQEAATILEIPIGTIKSRSHEGICRLQRMLGVE